MKAWSRGDEGLKFTVQGLKKGKNTEGAKTMYSNNNSKGRNEYIWERIKTVNKGFKP